MKKAIIIVVILAAVIATIPLWGGCDLNARFCNTTCSIKYFNNDMKAAGCRTRCSMKNASCHADEAAKEMGDFMKGLQGR